MFNSLQYLFAGSSFTSTDRHPDFTGMVIVSFCRLRSHFLILEKAIPLTLAKYDKSPYLSIHVDSKSVMKIT